ncbi:MAG: immunity 26/phosphotriesterase HocA family protein [Muribaculaceae bacterium]|nr:immunity 26/phosphotriesterase HocA family protein [Muribaculaceae bacterium]
MSSPSTPSFLTNDQRKYLGLNPVEDSWELVYLSKKYGTYLYFDGDIIRKIIHLEEDGSYYEGEAFEHTAQNHTILLPKTNRGKPKKLNYTATLSFSTFGIYFSFSSQMVIIANYTTQTTYYSQEFNDESVSLQQWLNKWVEESNDNDLKDIEAFKNTKRRHVKYREGDFFTFKIGRRKWGFGRIVLNIAERRKSPQFKKEKNYGLANLMGQALYIMIYDKISDKPETDIDKLINHRALPVQSIMDNRFYYGEYKIIGNRTVQPEEWEPIISYGRWDKENVYLQYGLIFKEKPIRRFNKYLIDEKGETSPYKNEGIGFYIDNYDILEDLLTGNTPKRAFRFFWDNDLRKEENINIKREIFKTFGLDPDKSYAENLMAETQKSEKSTFFDRIMKFINK